MCKYKFVFIYGLTLSIGNVFAQTEVGDSCVDEASGKDGICTSYTRCPSAKLNFELHSILPTNCGQRFDIVCCVSDAPTTTRKPTTTSVGISERFGHSCTDSGMYGICISYQNCPSAKLKFHLYGHRPTICGQGLNMVCCVQDSPETTRKPTTKEKRISKLKCEEYSKQVTKDVQYILNTATSSVRYVPVPNCEYKENKLILGGTPARPKEYPHMAAIGWPAINGYKFKCGGALISERFVLTAAHCSYTSRDSETTGDTPIVVRLGDHKLENKNGSDARPITVGIKRIIRHPKYTGTFYNDICLLELNEVLVFNSFVRPACLWQKDDYEGIDKLVVAGWGVTKYRGEQSKKLLKITIMLFPNVECDRLLKNTHNSKFQGLQEEQMCAGDLTGNHDTCLGDSGSPLVLTRPGNDCLFYVTGTVSFGPPCGTHNAPGVYARVAPYLPWIESIVWPK